MRHILYRDAEQAQNGSKPKRFSCKYVPIIVKGPMDMRTSKHYYRVDKRRISLIKFIFEAYEGLAVVSTVNASTGLIVLAVAPHCSDLARRVMTDLGKQFPVEPQEEPAASRATMPCGDRNG